MTGGDDSDAPHSLGQPGTDDARPALATTFDTDPDPLAQYADAFAKLDGTVALERDHDQPSEPERERSRSPSDTTVESPSMATTAPPHVDPFELFWECVLEERDPAASTRRGYRRAIAQWRTYMAGVGRHPACPNVTHVRGFARARQADHGNQPTTILTKLHRLHAVFQYWQADPVFPHSHAYDPFALALSTLALTRTAQRDYPWIALETLRAIIDDIVHVRARALVVSQLKLGLRASEVSNLQIEDLTLDDTACQRWYAELGTHPHVRDRANAVYVPPAHERDGNKSARPRVLPIDDELRRVLRAWLLVRPQNGTPWVFLTAGTHTHLDAASVNRAWTEAFQPRFAETPSTRAVTSHYGRHRFTTFWRVEQDLPRELVQYMRGDVLGNRTTTDGSDRGRDAIDDYLHAYYEDIEAVYRARMYRLGV